MKLFDPPKPVSDWSYEQKKAFETMNRCKPATLELFQRGANCKHVGGNSNVVDPAARMEEWTDEYGRKSKGPRKGGKAQGIVRKFGISYIWLCQFKDNKMHGLDITWWDKGEITVQLWKNGNQLGHIDWDTDDWTEVDSRNTSVFDGVVSINDFRP